MVLDSAAVSSAATPNPPATAAEAGVTREEFAALQAQLQEFREANERLANASTVEEEARREREQREAAEQVERTAQRLGMAPADVGEIRAWMRAETKEAVREVLEELAEVRRSEGEGDGEPPAGGGAASTTLAELAGGNSPNPGDATAGGGGDRDGSSAAGPATTPPEPPAREEPPQREHWFHRPIGGDRGGDA
jgi:hypothetical protein